VGPTGLSQAGRPGIFFLFGADLLVDAPDCFLKSVVGCLGPKRGVARPAGLEFPPNSSN